MIIIYTSTISKVHVALRNTNTHGSSRPHNKRTSIRNASDVYKTAAESSVQH